MLAPHLLAYLEIDSCKYFTLTLPPSPEGEGIGGWGVY